MVSALTIIRSRKLIVIQMISYLSRDSRIRTTISTSDSAADSAGRRVTASQKKLSRPQTRQKTTFGTKPTSLQSMRASAAACAAAISAMRRAPRRPTASGAAQRLVRVAMKGGMTGGPCPAMTTVDARHTDRRHQTALIPSFQVQTRERARRRPIFAESGAPINTRSSRRARLRSESLDQAGVDEQPVEAAGLRAAAAEIEHAATAAEDLLLLRERGVERDPRRFQHHQRKVGRIERIERGRQVDWAEVHPLDGVVGGEIARIALHDALRHLGLIERRVDEAAGKQRLVVAEAHDEDRLAGKLAGKALLELRIVVHAHFLAAQIFVDLRRVARIDPGRKQIGRVAEIPGEVVGREKEEDEDRAVGALARDHVRGVVVVNRSVSANPVRNCLASRKCSIPVLVWKPRAPTK